MLKKLIFSSLFGLLLFLQSGLADLALAATACDMGNFEGFFLGPDGKTTYAVTKQSLTWQNASALAKSGAGRLAVVTSSDSNTAIFSNLSSHFTVAQQPSSGKKAWIDLLDPTNSPSWSVPGYPPVINPNRFSWADGFSSYQNWASGQPDGYCTADEMAVNPDHNCYGEPWAAVNANGTWSDEGDHGTTPITLKGVVEWPNTTLDCVQIITPPTPPTVAPMPGSSTGAQWCTDQSKGTLLECNNTADGQKLCPANQAQCTEISSGTLNCNVSGSSDSCTAPAGGSCSMAGLYEDSAGWPMGNGGVVTASFDSSCNMALNGSGSIPPGSSGSVQSTYGSIGIANGQPTVTGEQSYPGTVTTCSAKEMIDGHSCSSGPGGGCSIQYGNLGMTVSFDDSCNLTGPTLAAPGGTTYYSNGIVDDPVLNTSVVTCPNGGTPIGGNCLKTAVSNVCPTDTSLACKQISGDTSKTASGNPVTYCSPNPCQADSSGWVTANDTQSGLDDKTNDGPKDANGNCTGQIYLFNGQDLRCRVFDRNGMTAAYAKLIAEIVLSCTGAGAALAGAMMLSGVAATAVINAVIQIAVNTAIELATNTLPSGSNFVISSAVSLVSSYIGAGGSMDNLGDSLADGMATIGLNTGATSLADPVLDTVVQQIGNTVSQYSPAIQQGMMGSYTQTKCCYPDKLSSSCDPKEIAEATSQGNGLCHVVGDYISSRMLMVDMVKKRTSCCFSSKLGRIFHEQGRPQLSAFGLDGGWGSARQPNCRGFTPEEFQSLDFSSIDLSEYEADLSTKMDKIKPILSNYMSSMGQNASQQLQNQLKK